MRWVVGPRIPQDITVLVERWTQRALILACATLDPTNVSYLGHKRMLENRHQKVMISFSCACIIRQGGQSLQFNTM